MADQATSRKGKISANVPKRIISNVGRGRSHVPNRDAVIVKAPSAIEKEQGDQTMEKETLRHSNKNLSSLAARSSIPTGHKSKKKNVFSTNDAQVSDVATKPISKTIAQTKLSSKPVDINFMKGHKSLPREERIVGGSQNASAVFGGQIEESSSLSAVLVKQARQSGQLNLSNRNLASIPDRIWRINDPDDEEQKRMKKGLSFDKIEEDSWSDHVDLNKLILASNQITEVSCDIQFLQALTVLDLHDNQLACLPEEIGKLENLTKINLNHNRLIELPMKFFDMRNLRTLTFCHNKMVDISEDLGRLDMLEYLDVSHNELTSLPSGLGFLTKCTKLIVSHNKLDELPAEIGFLRSSQMMDFSHNVLKETPKSTQELHNLQQLYLHHNKLTQLPNLKQCSHLKELLLGYNSIEEISEENIENTANQLKVLDLRDNKLKMIPDEIVNLQSLERLDVSNNNLSNLPYALGTLPHIKSLMVDGNPMKSIRRDIIQRGTVGLLKFLRMRIDDDELKRLREKGNISPIASPISGSPPVPDKYAMKTAQMMNMSKKEIRSLPDEAVSNAIEADVNGVDLSQNFLSEFPQNLEPLIGKLFELNLSHNKICKDLPGSLLGQGKHLQYLNFSNNLLDKLPKEIGTLANLREICLSFNKFDSIPNAIQSCEKLETLLLNGNQIKVIDVDGLRKLKALTVLDLSNNDVQHVPPELGTITQLRSLLLDGNPFRVPRPQILVQGTQSIMNYLRDRIPTN